MSKNFKMLTVVGPFPKGRIVSEEDMKEEGADFKFLLRVKAIEETTEKVSTDELPLGPPSVGFSPVIEDQDENSDIGTHLDPVTGERVADLPASGAVRNSIVANAKAPTTVVPPAPTGPDASQTADKEENKAPPAATKESAPAAKGATGTKESVGPTPKK